jgi:AcrR family transcriptional regulator
MARPTFAPTEDQTATLRRMQRVVRDLATAEAALTELITEADAKGVPIEHIARHAGVTKKTVYRRLGRTMR